jgi:hypothetical protein
VVVPGAFAAYLRAMHENAEAPPPLRSLLVVVGAAVFAVAGTVLLWALYGSAVFFETIRAGFVACFG